MTCWGRLVWAASLVMEMELVLVARMTSGWRMRSRFSEESRLHVEALGSGLDGEVGGCEVAEVGGGRDAGAGFVGLLLGEFFFGDFAGEVLLDS